MTGALATGAAVTDAAVAGSIVADWPAPARVRALVTTRALPGESQSPFDSFNLGSNCGDDADAVAANRQALISLFDLPAAPKWLRQVHGTHVARFDGAETAEACVADASVTSSENVVLCVLSADCLPVFVCADDGSEIGVVHAGWRGLAAGVIERCIEQLRTPRTRLLAWLGPAIGPRSYEVGDEVRDAFVAQHADAAAAFVATRPQHWLCDLYELARLRLREFGVERIGGGDFDTFADPRFYSYRRDQKTGRFASLIWIAKSDTP